MITETIWVRHTTEDGKTYVEEHRTWDKTVFLGSLLDAAIAVGGKCFVQQITEQQYKEERKCQRRSQ